jgi:hypothetical protein
MKAKHFNVGAKAPTPDAKHCFPQAVAFANCIQVKSRALPIANEMPLFRREARLVLGGFAQLF